MPGLKGVRVLLVEDEALLLIELQDILADLGAVIVGSAAQVAQALELAHNADFDVAILDVNLGSQRIDGVAKVIAARGIPLVFATSRRSVVVSPRIRVPSSLAAERWLRGYEHTIGAKRRLETSRVGRKAYGLWCECC